MVSTVVCCSVYVDILTSFASKMGRSSSKKITEYKVGDLVWAKLKGFPPWPGKIIEPEQLNCKLKDELQNTYRIINRSKCIYFFGDQKYAWVEIGGLKPYHKFKKYFVEVSKSLMFKRACLDIEKYIAKQKKI